MKTTPGRSVPVQGVLVFGDEIDESLVDIAAQVRSFFADTADKLPSRPRGKKVDYTKAFNLDLPLFQSAAFIPDAGDDIQERLEGDASPTDLSFSPVEEAAPAVAANESPSEGEGAQPFHDTLETWCAAHAGVLYRSLEVLLWSKDESSKARQEIVEWIFTEVVTYTDHKDGKTFRVKARDFPFSFENCCLAEGIDCEYARDRIWLLLERTRKGVKVKKAALH